MEKISDDPACFVVSLKEVKKYGLSPLEQLKRNPETKLLFPKELNEVREMQGKIITCVNQGSLVQILVDTEDGLENLPVDHRCFQHIVEAKGDIREKEIE